MRIITVLLIAIVLLPSCGLELTKVDVDLENGFAPEVAINSYLIPDSIVNLKLVLTRAAYSTQNTNPILKNATIERLSDNQVFPLFKQQKAGSLQLYSEELKPIAGAIYKMHIETQQPVSVLESIDTIPYITPILNAEVLSVEKSSTQLGKLTLKPNNNSKGTHYYELAIFVMDKSSTKSSNIFYQNPITTNNQIITREDYYPSMLLIGALEPQSLLFRVNNPNNVVNIDFIYSGGSGWSSAKGKYTVDHDIRLELRSVSYAYFRYKTSLYRQGYAASGDLLYGMAAPVSVNSNIKGGLGIFSGYSKCDTIISVAGRTGLAE
jgi:hypothetical protein